MVGLPLAFQASRWVKVVHAFGNISPKPRDEVSESLGSLRFHSYNFGRVNSILVPYTLGEQGPAKTNASSSVNFFAFSAVKGTGAGAGQERPPPEAGPHRAGWEYKVGANAPLTRNGRRQPWKLGLNKLGRHGLELVVGRTTGDEVKTGNVLLSAVPLWRSPNPGAHSPRSKR